MKIIARKRRLSYRELQKFRNNIIHMRVIDYLKNDHVLKNKDLRDEYLGRMMYASLVYEGIVRQTKNPDFDITGDDIRNKCRKINSCYYGAYKLYECLICIDQAKEVFNKDFYYTRVNQDCMCDTYCASGCFIAEDSVMKKITSEEEYNKPFLQYGRFVRKTLNDATLKEIPLVVCGEFSGRNWKPRIGLSMEFDLNQSCKQREKTFEKIKGELYEQNRYK